MRISAGFAFRRVARAFFALALPFVFRAAPVFASDAALLSKLAERGTLGVSEVSEIKKLSARIPAVAPSMQRPLRVSAKMQAQYEYISAECLEGGAEGGDSAVGKFIIRRMILTVNSDKNLDWGAQLSFDFMFANKTSITYLWRKIDAEPLKGELRIGYIKPNFCFEENMSPFDLYAVERSVATYFWTGPRNARRLGFGSFMTGAYWFGEPREIRGLRYALGVSNSENYRLGFNSVSGGNAPNLWLSSSYSFDCFGAKADVGGNFGWGADADKTSSGPSAGMWGANPYVSVRLGGMRAMSEFLAAARTTAQCSAAGAEGSSRSARILRLNTNSTSENLGKSLPFSGSHISIPTGGASLRRTGCGRPPTWTETPNTSARAGFISGSTGT